MHIPSREYTVGILLVVATPQTQQGEDENARMHAIKPPLASSVRLSTHNTHGENVSIRARRARWFSSVVGDRRSVYPRFASPCARRLFPHAPLDSFDTAFAFRRRGWHIPPALPHMMNE